MEEISRELEYIMTEPYQRGYQKGKKYAIDEVMKYVRLHTKYADNTKNDFIYAHQMYEWLEQLKEKSE